MKRPIGSIVIALLALATLASPAASVGGALAARPIGARAHRYIGLVPNVFASARGLILDSPHLDAYIAPSVTGADRILARHLMSFMPPNQRGDFIYMGENGRLVSNNPALLRYAKVDFGRIKQNPASLFSSSVVNRPGFIHPNDYSSYCSPPNPFPGTGPYVRQVSQCGFAAGWAFVYLKCGTTISNNNDSGHLYFELQGNGIGVSSKSLIEGGLEYYSDDDIAPYLKRSVDGSYETLTNGADRYSCDSNLAIWHGSTIFTDPNTNRLDTFTEVGNLPSSYDPETLWVNQQIVNLDNAAWLFGPATKDISNGGTDSAGYQTPCSACSISQVTSIAQSGTNSYDEDGSTFGVSSDGQSNTINWLQVGFGDWASDCQPGTTLCIFDVAADPSVYYGGPQYYPNDYISQSNYAPTGYGPYETYDGIALPLVGIPSLRNAVGTFSEPLAPLPCSLDASGLCASQSSVVDTKQQCDPSHGQPQSIVNKEQVWYQVYSGRKLAEVASSTTTWSIHQNCIRVQMSQIWSPKEPKIQYNDPNLP